jgi:DNA ligase 1
VSDRFRPCLGASVSDVRDIRFPVFASCKLDGVRAIWWVREFMSRTLKTIPNRALQKRAVAYLADMPRLDGELVWGEPNAKDVYRATVSKVMRDYDPAVDQVRFFVFDNVDALGGFGDRLDTLSHILPFVVKLDQHLIEHPDDLLALEERAVADGFEGLICRSPNGHYKYGRGTLRDQVMLKIKRFKDAEAEVVGFQELLHNANEQTVDQRGYSKRSSHQDGKVPMGVLGALLCRTPEGTDFAIGTGFTAADREEIWRHREAYLGRLAKYKSFDIGVKVAPRHSVFLGWRDPRDL